MTVSRKENPYDETEYIETSLRSGVHTRQWWDPSFQPLGGPISVGAGQLVQVADLGSEKSSSFARHHLEAPACRRTSSRTLPPRHIHNVQAQITDTAGEPAKADSFAPLPPRPAPGATSTRSGFTVDRGHRGSVVGRWVQPCLYAIHAVHNREAQCSHIRSARGKHQDMCALPAPNR